MKTRSYSSIRVTTLLALAITTAVLAQVSDGVTGKVAAKQHHHHYKVLDSGTFGGPSSYVNALVDGAFFGSAKVMSRKRIVAGWADTSSSDPFPSLCFDASLGDCFVSHAFRWHDGFLTDLGTLAEGWSSAATWINETGDVVGVSQNGVIDPLIGFPEQRAVLWRNGRITDLGTLGGNQSAAAAINNHGQVAGLALNSIPDPLSIYDVFYFGSSAGTQTRAVLWDKDGTAQDLGTLGGPDAAPGLVNDRGQVTGISYTNSTPNPSSGGLPTFHPFLWEKGKGMVDLGTLGGTVAQAVNGLNERGEVVGSTTMAGDQTHHPFLWDGKQLIDLGTFGGPNGEADWINDDGEVVGIAQLPEFCPVGPGLAGGGRAFLWRRGVLIDLGTTAGVDNSEAVYINSKTQVVGYSFACDFSTIDAFLWENDSIVDLNALTLPNAGLQLLFAQFIDDKGEIVGLGLLPSGDVHVVQLIPCDESHPDIEGCDYSPMEVSTVAASHTTAQRQMTPEEISRIHALLMNRHRGFMPRTLGSVH
jgi:probable HAF family extracellular repeat protein